MPPQPDDQKKRQQFASPEKQKGVRSHDRKRRLISQTHTESDMDELDNELYSSPAPLTIPPPPSMESLLITGGPTPNACDADEDTTMVNLQTLQVPADWGPGGLSSPAAPETPTHKIREDLPWIIKRTKRTPINQGNDNLVPPQVAPQLPRDLTRTPTPVGGFPEIHMLIPPWFNLLPDQRIAFGAYPDPKLWIREWQVSNDTDLMGVSDKLRELVLRMTGEKAKLSTPQAEKEIFIRYKKDKQKPPYHFLISGISSKASNVLLAYSIIFMPEASAFILPYNPPLPRFLCMLEGFTLSIQTPEARLEAKEMVTEIVQRALFGDEVLITLLKGKLIDDDTSQHNFSPATDILRTIEVKLAKGEDMAERAPATKHRKPLWNVFFRCPPPISWMSYFILLQHLRNTKFIDLDYGSATLTDEENRLHCNKCKGANHNPTHCSFGTLDGWYGNQSKDKVEESLEFALSDRYKGQRYGGGNRNDRRAEIWRFGSRGRPYSQRRERC
ncbi:hypothetical protein C0992_000884 [Termitomyces sp. T32_za158]|nr:hypothetical protein C0992_000884 [Termitomyces sp. T32_za158]